MLPIPQLAFFSPFVIAGGVGVGVRVGVLVCGGAANISTPAVTASTVSGIYWLEGPRFTRSLELKHGRILANKGFGVGD